MVSSNHRSGKQLLISKYNSLIDPKPSTKSCSSVKSSSEDVPEYRTGKGSKSFYYGKIVGEDRVCYFLF